MVSFVNLYNKFYSSLSNKVSHSVINVTEKNNNILIYRSKAQAIQIHQWETKYLNEIYKCVNTLQIIKSVPTTFLFDKE
jgi:hypothetical protein